jgi:outer membrane protein assembly factor BamA
VGAGAASQSAALAQSSAPAGDATGIFRPLGTGTMQSLFPLTTAPSVTQIAVPQITQIGGIQDRVRTRSRNAPNREDVTIIGLDDPTGNGHFNALFGGIGQGGGISGGIEVTTGDSFKGVEIYGDALISSRLYYALEVGAVFGTPESKLKGDVRFRFSDRKSDSFFGLGPFSEEEVLVPLAGQPFIFGGETNYRTQQRQLSGSIYYNFTKRFQAGVYVDFRSTSSFEGEDDNDPSIFSLYTAYQPGIECFVPVSQNFFVNQLPGLGAGSKIITYGAYAEYDRRDYDFGLTKGFYGYARYASHDDVDEAVNVDFPALGTYDYGWSQVSLDARFYIPVFSDRSSIALRYTTELNDRKGGSVIPFYELAKLGGNNNLRGFRTFRFHGANSVVFQGEFRQNVIQFEDNPLKGIDVNVFADAGQVWGKGFEALCFNPLEDYTRGDRFDFDNYEVDFGVGLTARISKTFAVRFDFAHSNESNAVRLVFNRGF